MHLTRLFDLKDTRNMFWSETQDVNIIFVCCTRKLHRAISSKRYEYIFHHCVLKKLPSRQHQVSEWQLAYLSKNISITLNTTIQYICTTGPDDKPFSSIIRSWSQEYLSFNAPTYTHLHALHITQSSISHPVCQVHNTGVLRYWTLHHHSSNNATGVYWVILWKV